MGYSASLAGNIYFWLFWVFLFPGIAAGLAAAALIRKRRLAGTGALFALTGSATAVLGTILLVELSAVSWNRNHLWFSLFVLLLFFLIWSFKKYVALPFLVLVLLFSLQLHRNLSPWLSIQNVPYPGNIKVHLVSDDGMTVSIDTETSLVELKGSELFLRYRVLAVDPRLFFLPREGFMLLESIADYRVPHDSKVLDLSSLSGRLLSAAGLWEVIEKESSKVRPLPFTTYRMLIQPVSQELALDIIPPAADR